MSACSSGPAISSTNASHCSENPMRIPMTKISVVQLSLVFSAVLVLILASTFVMQSREASFDQARGKLIKFSHQFHVKDAGVSCQDCHSAAATSKASSDNLLAKKANCQSCHEEQIANNCTYCHTSDDVSTYAAFENPKRDLLFNHEFHLNDQKLTCETCHKGLDEMTIATDKSIPEMAQCMTCHDGAQAQNACETCHTNFATLRPKEHNRTNFVKEHKLYARMQDASCASCHTQESCQDCHVNAGLVQTTPGGADMVSPRSPRLTANDRAQGMALTRVHDLNFRFTHGIAASAKITECATCHDSKDFCSTCHAAGGNVNQLEFRPQSHQRVRFVTIGVGSGGGLHAYLARRDIESCMSCHDAQGADPTCITCHVDPDGIRGTDARPHAPGFMASNGDGNWHSDPGANCFVCHTDANARVGGVKGLGFCGYCHK